MYAPKRVGSPQGLRVIAKLIKSHHQLERRMVDRQNIKKEPSYQEDDDVVDKDEHERLFDHKWGPMYYLFKSFTIIEWKDKHLKTEIHILNRPRHINEMKVNLSKAMYCV